MRKKTIHRKVMKNGYRTIEKQYKNSMVSTQYGGYGEYNIGDNIKYIGESDTFIDNGQIGKVEDTSFGENEVQIIYKEGNGLWVPVVVSKTDIEPYPPPPPAPPTIRF